MTFANCACPCRGCLPVAMPNNGLPAVLNFSIRHNLCRRATLLTRCCYDSIRYWFHPHASNCRYPIYRIPTGPTLKDLDACFLTFHCLATPCKDCDPSTPACPGFGGINRCTNATGKLSLPIFGLAPYKFRASIWASDGTQERERVTLLMQEADSWLRRIRVDHPDFRWFASHFNTTWR